jgi:hypothetical protein
MKKFFLVFLLMIVVFSSSNQLNAQWVQTNGPEGGEVNCLAAYDTTLFLGSEIGVYSSTDNGTSWNPTGLDNIIVISLAVMSTGESGMNLFAGTFWGIYLSADNGTSWSKVSFGLGNHKVHSLAVIDTNLFAGTEDGVFLSPTNGTYWIPVSTGLTNKSINSLTVIDTNLYAGTKEGLFISTNNGTTWNLTGLTGESINALAVIDTNLFAGTDTSGVLRSTDNGVNWEIISNPDMDKNIGTLAVSKTDLFVGTSNGFYMTPNKGTYWIPLTSGLTNTVVHALASSDTYLFVGTSGGMFRSTNNGTNWTEINVGLKTTVVSSLATSGDTLYAGSRGGIYRSNDTGNSWSSLLMGGTSVSIAISGPNLFAGSGGHLVNSFDNGASWDWLHLEECRGWIRGLAIMDSYIFAGGEAGGVCRIKHNAPGWWTILSTGQPDTVVNCLVVKGKNIFAGTMDGVYLSTDSSKSWSAINNGLTSLEIKALTFNDTHLFAGTWEGGVFRSMDNGDNWTPVNNGLTDLDMLSFTVSGDNLFAGTWQGGVFLSTNNGDSWTAVNEGLMESMMDPTSVVQSLAIVDSDIYAGTRGAGVWRRPLAEMITSVENVSSELPRVFSLEQNYPNPYNSSTTIEFELPRSEHIKIEVYNSLGQKVSELINKLLPAGFHKYEFNGFNLPSGLYIYIIEAGQFQDVKKMLYLK